MYGVEFMDLRIGCLFHWEGGDYVKQSTRTARQLATGQVCWIPAHLYIHPMAW